MGIKSRSSLLVGLCLALLFVAAPARASEKIIDNTTKVQITADGKALFTEILEYEFDGDHHGIYRDIPYITKLPDGKYLHYEFELDSIKRQDADEKYSVSEKGSFKRIKIGDPDSTVSGIQSYLLDYTLSPFVRHDPAGDYITINVVSTEWEVPNEQAQSTVTLPEGVSITKAICYTGSHGSRDSNCEATVSGNVVNVRSKAGLASKEGMTLDIVTPANSFESTAYLEPSTEGPPSDIPGGVGGILLIVAIFILFPLLVLVVPIILLVKFLVFKKQEKYQRQLQTVVPQYDAPDKMLPGEIGLLSDNVAGIPEISATVIHLATRGYLKIGYEMKTGFLASGNTFRFTRLKPSSGLEAFESNLLEAIFSQGDSVLIGDLDRTRMSTTVELVKSMLKERLQKSGYLAMKQKLWSSHNVTDDGYKEWAKVEGFKLYLNVAEKDRIQFHEAPAKTPEHFSKLLPYAIALGVEKQWAAHFADMDVSSAVNWYEGDMRSMTAIGFSQSFSSAFTSSMNSNFSPPSSSGGSSGGFSGGGGGGGGGGSW